MNALLAYLRNLLQFWLSTKPVIHRSFRPDGIDSWAQVDSDAAAAYDDESVVIVGIVGYRPWGYRKGTGFSVKTIELCAWGFPSEPLREDKLLLLVPRPKGGLWSIDLPNLSMWRMTVVLSHARDQAILVSWEATRGDAASAAVLRRLREPVVIRDDLLGDLTFDFNVRWFAGKTTWNGSVVRACLRMDDEDSTETARAAAAGLWADQSFWSRRIEEFAASELLDLANDWVGHGEKRHTREDFLSRMKLNTISLEPDGEFEFWYDDGDLFWGHSICVRGDLAAGPRTASMEG